MADNINSTDAAGGSETMRLTVDTATEQSAARIAQLLNPAGGAMDKKALRRSIDVLAQNVLEAAVPITVGEAIQDAIDAMTPDCAKALASLGQDNQTAQPRLDDAIRALRQELSDAIELGTRSALGQAIGKIGDSALQIASAAGSLDSAAGTLTVQARERLRQALRDNYGAALRSVSDTVSQAVTAIAAKALAQFPQAAKANQAATQSSTQVPFEVGIRA